MPSRAPTFRPISQGPNLTGNLAGALQARIEAGELGPGQQLPTEQAIVASTGVSRTVVREALASLRAKGLITTRQGRGAFVAERVETPPSFSIAPSGSDPGSIGRILHVLELRLGLEVEAAGLAAERRTDADLLALEAALHAFEAAFDRPDGRAEHDFAFHRAMLVATRNPYFAEVFDVLGTLIIPRQKLRLDTMDPAERMRYLRGLGREHQAVASAIRAGDAPAARRAVRQHLGKAHLRYQTLGALTPHGDRE